MSENKKILKWANANVSEIAQSLAVLKRDSVEICEFMKEMAKIRKASYDAHIESGFSKEEALELCKLISQ